jgi:hypothetical protein
MRIAQLIVLSSLAACGAAAQDPTPAVPTNANPSTSTKSPTCSGGDVLYQVDFRDTRLAKPDDRARSLIVRDSGAWSFDVHDGNKLTRKDGGCLAAADTTRLVSIIDGAPWTSIRHDATCEIHVVAFTEYQVRGKHVWSAKGCAGHGLDDKSLAAIEAAAALLKPHVKGALGQ